MAPFLASCFTIVHVAPVNVTLREPVAAGAGSEVATTGAEIIHAELANRWLMHRWYRAILGPQTPHPNLQTSTVKRAARNRPASCGKARNPLLAWICCRPNSLDNNLPAGADLVGHMLQKGVSPTEL